MKRIGTVVLLCGILIAALVFTGVLVARLAAAAPSSPQSGGGQCSLQTLNGPYSARIAGWAGSGPGRLPYAAAGFVNLDGRGGIVAGAATQSLDGAISIVQITGTYTVNPDCTGQAVSTIGNFYFTIGDNGKQTRIVSNTPGTTVQGEAIRQ